MTSVKGRILVYSELNETMGDLGLWKKIYIIVFLLYRSRDKFYTDYEFHSSSNRFYDFNIGFQSWIKKNPLSQNLHIYLLIHIKWPLFICIEANADLFEKISKHWVTSDLKDFPWAFLSGLQEIQFFLDIKINKTIALWGSMVFF